MKIQPTPILSNPQYNPERPIRPREPDPHSQRTERDSERGGGDLWIQMNWRGELVVRVGFGD